MKSSVRVLALILTILAVGAAGFALARTIADARRPPATPEVMVYLDTAFAIMRAHAINRETLDWDALRAETNARARGARATPDSYDALNKALQKVNRHSRIYTGQMLASLRSEATRATPRGEWIEEHIGYITLPTIINPDSTSSRRYAAAGQELVKTFDGRGACGWIVDLRDDHGGSVYAMLLAIAPLFDRDTLGFFLGSGTQRWTWGATDSTAFVDSLVRVRFPGGAIAHRRAPRPVAILTGSGTTSAGEAVVVAFRGQRGTRTFGSATGGFTTGNADYPLPDGARISLTMSVLADRTGHAYGDEIRPDVTISAKKGDRIVRDAALQWLRDQPECMRR